LQESDAEDVTQNVLLKLAERLRTFEYDPKFRFRCYLKTLTRTACHDYVAAKKKSVAGSGDSEVVKILEQVEAQDDLATRLEAAFDQELLQLAALAVKKRVDDNTWEAFRLMAQEGKSGAEVAEALHMQVGTVFKAKSKVQKMLREEIEKLESPS
jgi:RNA polymerase sigma-70 factor (ECF subfamily)